MISRDLACLDELGDLVHDGLGRGGVGDLIDLDEVFLFVVAPAGADLHAAAARAVNFAQGVDVADDLAAGREIGRKQRLCQVAVGILEVGDRRVAHLAEVEAAQLARHADGNALIGAHEDVREGRRQQRRLLHGVVVVVDEIDGIGVDVAEQLGADGGELCLRVAARRPRHVARVDLTEVALGVHERVQQRTVALGKAHHRVIDGGVAVGIEPHGLTDDVRALRARAVQQSHLIHGIEELAVAGLEAVDLRNGARDDDRHRVGHIVRLQRIGDALLDHVRTQAEDVGVIAVQSGLFPSFRSSSWCPSNVHIFCHYGLYQLFRTPSMRGRGAKRRLFFAALHKRGKRLSCFLAKIPSCFFLSRPVSFAKETNEGGHSHDAVCVQKEIPSCWCFYFYQHRFC